VDDDRVRTFSGKRIEVTAGRRVPLELDGELLDPCAEAVFEIDAGAITLCVPGSAESTESIAKEVGKDTGFQRRVI
jgi:diacylglycerol kinase family enzyme